MFKSMFRPDSPLMMTLTQITDCIFLSLFFLLGCVPVVTVGASGAALYDSIFGCYRQRDKHPWHRFWESYRRNVVPGLIPTVIYLAVSYVLAKFLIGVWNAAVYGTISWVLFSAAAIIGVCAMGVLGVLFPLLSRFENKTGVFLKNTVLLAFSQMPRTLTLGALNTVVLFLCVRFIFPLFFLPGLGSLLSTFLLEPMFKPFLPDSDTAEQ